MEIDYTDHKALYWRCEGIDGWYPKPGSLIIPHKTTTFPVYYYDLDSVKSKSFDTMNRLLDTDYPMVIGLVEVVDASTLTSSPFIAALLGNEIIFILVTSYIVSLYDFLAGDEKKEKEDK